MPVSRNEPRLLLGPLLLLLFDQATGDRASLFAGNQLLLCIHLLGLLRRSGFIAELQMLLLLTTDKNALLLANEDDGGAGYLLQHGHNKLSACQVLLRVQAPHLP